MVLMGYLICEKCEGYYQLQEKEDPEDFESCECGGKLIFVENLIDYYGENLDESLIKKDSEQILESDSANVKLPVLKLINLKALFLGGVIWVALDALLYGVSTYSISGLALVSLVAAQLFAGMTTGYISGRLYKSGILNSFIVGIFFAAVLFLLRSNPSMILIVILAFSVLLTIIGGVSGVFIFGKTEKTNKKDTRKNTETAESSDDAPLKRKKEDWPKNLAVWLAGLGVLFLFLYFPIFGGILILFALLIYAFRNYMVIYAFVGAYLGYTFIQMIFGVLGLFYANMSTYEREDMCSFVALTIFNLVISGYVLYRTRKLDKKVSN